MATPRLQALQNLQNQLPVASQRVAQGIQTARDIQLQQAVAKAPVGAATAPAAQQTAAAATEQAGQQQVEAAKQMVQQAGQVGQLQLGEQQMGAQQQVAQAQQAARQQEINNAERLGRLDMSAKKELIDSQLQFQKDEAGRTLFNQRQLVDYAAQNARSEEDYKNYAQQADQLNKRKLQTMDTAYKIIEEDLSQRFRVAEQRKDQAAQQQIMEIRAEIERQKQRAAARAANSAAMWSSGATAIAVAGVGAAAAIYATGGLAAPWVAPAMVGAATAAPAVGTLARTALNK
jgi:hypothetical protein